MKTQIVGFEIWRCELPTGRVIGDCTSHYDTEDVFILALKTDQGLVGWRLVKQCQKACSLNPRHGLRPCLAWTNFARILRSTSGRLMQQSELQPLWERSEELFPSFSYRSVAIRTALWDLMAKSQEQPLHKLLGSRSDRVRAYGSGLDFPLTDAQADEIFRRFAERNFFAVKVKVGRPKTRT